MDASPQGHHQVPKSSVVRCSPSFPPPPSRALPFYHILHPLSPPAQDPREYEWAKTHPGVVSAVPQLISGFLSPAAAVKPTLSNTPGAAPGQPLPTAGDRGTARGPAARPEALRGGGAGRTLTTAPHAGAWSPSRLRAPSSGSPHPVAHGCLGLPPSRPPPRPSRPGHPPSARRAVGRAHART